MRPRLGRAPGASIRRAEGRRAGAARGDRLRGSAARLTLAGAIVLAALSAGCHDLGREQAEQESRDRVRLETIINADETLDRALKAADDASQAGDDAKAAALLEGDVARACTDAIGEAETQALETPRGRARRDTLLSVMRERQASIGPYAQALRGEDLDAKLAAVESQVALQRKALAAATDALSGL